MHSACEEKVDMIYVSLEHDISEFNLICCSFYKFSDGKGKFLFIEVDKNTNTPSSSAYIGTLDTYVKGYKELYWMCSKETSLSLSLLHSVYPLSFNALIKDIYVVGISKGIDAEGCGWDDLPCGSSTYEGRMNEHFLIFALQEIVFEGILY